MPAINLFFTALLFLTGLYCMLVSRNMLRLLIGMEILSKSCILAFISFGSQIGQTSTAQSIIITIIVVEVVVIGVGLALMVKTSSATGTIDIWKLNKLKD